MSSARGPVAIIVVAASALIVIAGVRPFNAPAQSGQHYAVDTDGHENLESLVAASDLIATGSSDGSAKVRAILGDGLFADFEQQIAVSDAIKGSAAGEITLIRLGTNPDAETPADPYAIGEELAGPVPAGDFLLFLQRGGAAGTWSVVGHTQGLMRIDVTGQVTSELPELDGLHASEAVGLIAGLAP